MTADPLTDLLAVRDRLETLPFHRHEPVIVSPRQHARYQRELDRLDATHRLESFHREIAWRRLHAKRLTPMYAAYRRRTRRRRR